jgi:outer membrane protein, multidrug efflux system
MKIKYNQLYTIGITLVIVLLVSCKAGKNYERVAVPLPAQFGTVLPTDTGSIADIEWKNFFTDTTLQGLIQRGIAYNYNLQLAVKRINIAQQQVKQARLAFLPSLDLQASGQYNYLSKNGSTKIYNPASPDHTEDYFAGGNFSWEIGIWGKIRRLKEAALARYLQTYEGAKAVQTQLVFDIANGFYNLLMLDEQLVIVHRNLLLNDSTVFITNLLKNSGEVTSLAVRQAESQKQTTTLLIPQIEQDIILQENALQILTGQLPGTIKRTVQLSQLKLRDTFPTGLPAAMLSRRPDVRSSEMAVVMANAEAGAAQANLYPSINITASGGVEAIKASQWFNTPNSLFALATGSLTAPVFRRRELKTQLEIAKTEREEAVIQFKQAVLNAVVEVSDALTQIEKLNSEGQIANNQVNTLRQAVVQAQFLFKSNMANYLEVITAQSNTLQAELNMASIQRRQLSAMADLYRSLGGGWR